MSKTISGQLNICDVKADEIMEMAKAKLQEKDYVHEALKDFVCSNLNTAELVFASYCLGAMMGQLRAEKSSNSNSNEMEKLMMLMRLLSK